MIFHAVCCGPFPINRKEKGNDNPISAIFNTDCEAQKFMLDYNSIQPPVRSYVMPVEIISASIQARLELEADK